MITIEARGPISEVAADGLIVPVGADRAWGPGADWVAEQLGDWLDGYLDQLDFTGKPGQVAAIPGSGRVPFTTVLLVGVGDAPDVATVRKAGGSAGRHAARLTTVATTFPSLVVGGAEAFTLGLLLGQYRFDKYRSEPKPSITERLILVDGDDATVGAAERALVVAGGVRLARDLVNEPAVAKPATEIARIAVELGSEAGLRVVVHDEEALAAGGYGGVLGVAAGAANPPRLVEMWHEPDGATAFLALVGKGVVFDSGGLSIKPAKSMEDMKTDMSGAAAVIAAMKVIAELGIQVRVVGITPLVENMTGGGATRPGDVLTIRNGKTIEVLNTDAEGRLILADGLSLAVEQEPDLIVDVATLTGAAKIALGDHIAALFGNGDGPVDQVKAAADRAGERVWAMPLPADYRSQIDSQVADMKNTGPRWGGAISAALLLKEFVGDVPWAHLDIAGPARASGDNGDVIAGGTGFGVRTLVALAEDLAT